MNNDFEMVPRVMKCFRPGHGVVFFHVSDNPFAPPANVLEKVKGKPKVWIRERWYGIANKMVSARFPKFNVNVHVLPAASIPKKGTNYHIVDPASGRNFWQHWIRRTPEAYYVYREWPGNYEIPEIGVPEPWALPDGKKPDGKAGRGQDTFGYGLEDYKREWARLERWKDWQVATGAAPAEGNKSRPAREWNPGRGAEETIELRYMDSRFASTPKIEADRPTTLLEEFADIGVDFIPAPGDDIAEGVQLLNDLLAYDPEKPVDFFNKPKLYVSAECVNTIFALQNWTGKDGAKGAMKDVVDTLRYMALAGLEHVEQESLDKQPYFRKHY